MHDNGSFRAEVLENQKNKNYGAVLINVPIHYDILTIGFLSLVGLIFIFLALGEFSEKFVVTGYLESSKGMVRIYPPRRGVITKCFVKQGEEIKKGDQLFLLATDYEAIKKNKHSLELQQLEKRKNLIEHEIKYQEIHLHALKKLLLKHYLSKADFHKQYEELVALKQSKNRVEVEIIKYQESKSYVIRSPINGVIANVLTQKGQYVDLQKNMLKILPLHADLKAELLVPAKHAGFLHQNGKIIIRYDAYPYMRFGTFTAAIDEIGQSILMDEEEGNPIRLGQPYYKVTARLDSQYINLYGQEKKVQQGMTFSAVIIGAKRKIWQWILDPFYSFYGRVFS